MSTHTSTKRKLLAWIVILAQVLARTSTGVATALQPTPDLAGLTQAQGGYTA